MELDWSVNELEHKLELEDMKYTQICVNQVDVRYFNTALLTDCKSGSWICAGCAE